MISSIALRRFNHGFVNEVICVCVPNSYSRLQLVRVAPSKEIHVFLFLLLAGFVSADTTQ